MLLEQLDEARNQRGRPHTATMTFVTFVDDKRIARWVRDRIWAIAEKHPSRVLFLDATQAEGRQQTDGSLAHSEWIELGVAKSSGRLLAGAVAELALPEAPIILLWSAYETASDERFNALAQRARRVICSTSVVERDTRALAELGAFVASHEQVAVADIAYLRLAPWQECVAGFFDSVEFTSELHAIRRVEVDAGSDPEAYYLVGWLASRLGWSPHAKDAFVNAQGSPISVKFVRTDEPRRIRRIALASESARFTAMIGDDPDAIILETGLGGEQQRRCGPLGDMDIASLVEQAILQGTQDRNFRASLAMVTAMLSKGAS